MVQYGEMKLENDNGGCKILFRLEMSIVSGNSKSVHGRAFLQAS